MASLPGPAARAAGRVCCVNGKCHKAHHLRMMKSTAPRESRRLLAELGACARLDREDLIRATVTLSRRTQLALATQCLDAMGHRHMRPSLVAHNALLEANARQRRWDYGLKLLLRMQQHGLQPNEVSYTSVIRASVGTPGSAQLVEMLLPQLLEARRRDLGVEPNARRGEGGSEGAGELGVGARAHEHKPPSAVASAAASAIWAGEPMTIGDLSPRAQAALLEARSSDAELLHSGEEGSEAPGLHLLQQQLADGAPTDAASFAHALSGCAKQPGRWREALQLTSMLESWVRMADGGRRARAQDRDVSRAFTLAISACDASGRAQPALDMLRRMDELGVPPAERHFSAAISACRHVETGGGLGAARELFDAMRRERVARTTYTYNAMLSVMAAEGGHGSEALELLARMQSEGGREAPPDGVTYLNVMMACRPTREQSAALRQAAYRRRRSEFGAERPPPQLTTPSPSASRDDVPGRGEEGATALSGGDAVAVAEPRAGAGEPIGGGVAADRQLALTDADEPPWRVAMRLLGEMGLRGIPPTVFTYGALMELCYRTSDLDGAMRLLREMPKRGLVPDGAVLGSAMRVVAAFGEQRIAISLLTEVEEEVRRLRLLDSTDTEPLPAGSSARRARTFGLFDARSGVDAAEGRGDGGSQRSGMALAHSGRPLTEEDRERLHNYAILACAVGRAPTAQLMAMVPLMISRGVQPNYHTVTALLDVCANRGAWEEATSLLDVAAEYSVPRSAQVYMRALRAYANPGLGGRGREVPWERAAALFERIEADGVALPSEERAGEVSVLGAAIAAGGGWEAMGLLERLGLDATLPSGARGGARPHARRAGLSGSPRAPAPAAKEREAALAALAERFCLAAQDGAEGARLPLLLDQMRELGGAPTDRLVKRALWACGRTREGREGWRNVPALLTLCRDEGLRPDVGALVLALQACPPAVSIYDGAGSADALAPASSAAAAPESRWGDGAAAQTLSSTADSSAPADGVGLRALPKELAGLLGMDPLPRRDVDQLTKLLRHSLAAEAHARRLVDALASDVSPWREQPAAAGTADAYAAIKAHAAAIARRRAAETSRPVRRRSNLNKLALTTKARPAKRNGARGAQPDGPLDMAVEVSASAVATAPMRQHADTGAVSTSGAEAFGPIE